MSAPGLFSKVKNEAAAWLSLEPKVWSHLYRESNPFFTFPFRLGGCTLLYQWNRHNLVPVRSKKRGGSEASNQLGQTISLRCIANDRSRVYKNNWCVLRGFVARNCIVAILLVAILLVIYLLNLFCKFWSWLPVYWSTYGFQALKLKHGHLGMVAKTKMNNGIFSHCSCMRACVVLVHAFAYI